jgi:predicted HNH restriction endonuclease
MSSKMMEQLMAINPADFAPICANCDYQMAHLRTENITAMQSRQRRETND